MGTSRAASGTSTSYELAPERLQAALGPAYELGRLIGRGGYAEVFAVRDLRLKRELALKVIRPDLILTDALVARFRREAEAVAALQNPHIVPVYDVGEADGICWLLMPLVRGETLKTLLAREGRIAVPEARRILLEAAEALQAAHEAGVVHRDIKPENLMIDGKTRRVLLMDFGIAKAMDANGEHAITGTGVVIGTPQYMSPEQAMGSRAPDPRSDQYALGVVGYQMIAGRVPFAGENVREVMARQLLEEAVPLSRLVPNLPPGVAATIHQALRKDPNLRFSSMEVFARSLRGELVADGEKHAGRRKSHIHIPQRRRPWVAAAAWVFVLAGGAWAADRAGLFAPPPPPPPAPPPTSPGAASAPAGVPREANHPPRHGTPQRPMPTPVTLAAPGESTATGAAPPEAVRPSTCDGAFQAADWPRAFRLCQAEASDSNPAAERDLGLLYAEGRGVERNERLAAVHLTFAAQRADTIAALQMAYRYETGKGVAVDQEKAAGFYHLAAELGVREAYPIVARRYDDANGFRENPKEAARWYQKAAEAGDIPSMTRLAAAYARGRGVKKDEDLARQWYSKAAEGRDPEAEYQIAVMLLEGKGGMKKNELDGMGWLRRAADHGHPEAKKLLAKRGG
jgi:TPR repeat protein/tRNA A-37 threonylcarbamoyl transferase component Bud32